MVVGVVPAEHLRIELLPCQSGVAAGGSVGRRANAWHAVRIPTRGLPAAYALCTADLLVLSVRRRTPPAEQLDAVRAYLAGGKPLVGVRTACHAFALRPTDPPAATPLSTWQDFDPEVLGGHYTNHHDAGPPTIVTLAPGAGTHPILKGIALARLTGAGSLYKVGPLESGTTPLLMGAIPGQPQEPVAWTHLYGEKQARVFYTSFGHPDDFKNAGFRRLLLNGVEWAIGR